MTSARDAIEGIASPKPRRADESGVQRKHTPLRPLNITPEVDALGYDPFEDRPTLVHAQSWRAAVAPQVDFPLPLYRKKTKPKQTDWLASLPEAARAVLLAAAEPVDVDAPRIAGAIAQPRQG